MTEKGFAEQGSSASITVSTSLCSALLVNPALRSTKDINPGQVLSRCTAAIPLLQADELRAGSVSSFTWGLGEPRVLTGRQS